MEAHTKRGVSPCFFLIYTAKEEEMFRAAWLLGKSRRTAKYNDGSITKTNLYL